MLLKVAGSFPKGSVYPISSKDSMLFLFPWSFEASKIEKNKIWSECG